METMSCTLDVSFRHDEAATVVYQGPTDSNSRPYVMVESEGMKHSVWISPRLWVFQAVTAEHVRFARELVDASRQYLAELERAYAHDEAMDDESSELEAA